MDECKNCANADNEYCFACDNGNQFKPVTNADRIRAMTDEELAEWIISITEDLTTRWLDWLKQEANDD